MKFYNREVELSILNKNRLQSERLSVMGLALHIQ